jgi:hypothetical protein
MAEQRLYRVTDTVEGKRYLVKAGSGPSAIKMLVEQRYQVDIPNPTEAVEMVQGGCPVLSPLKGNDPTDKLPGAVEAHVVKRPAESEVIADRIQAMRDVLAGKSEEA